jgi:hypothetical protein
MKAFIALLLSATVVALVAAPAENMVGASPPAAIVSVFVPPTSERSIVFSDRGRTYIVGVTTGKVIAVDGSAPFTPPQPPTPPTIALEGFAKTVYDSINAVPVDASKRKQGALALISAVDSAVSEAGGLGTTDPQAIINLLASNAEAAQVNVLLKGWRLGDLLAGANITTREQLLKAFEELKRGLEAIK